MPEHDDRLGARDLGRIFEAPDNIDIDDIAGHARAKHIADALIKNQFGWNARIDAADNSGEWRLVTGRLLYLRHQIAIDGLARREPLVSGLELCNRIVRRCRLLTIGSEDGAFGRLCVNGGRSERQSYREASAKESACNHCLSPPAFATYCADPMS